MQSILKVSQIFFRSNWFQAFQSQTYHLINSKDVIVAFQNVYPFQLVG